MSTQNNLNALYYLLTNNPDPNIAIIDNTNIWLQFYNNRKSIIKQNILNEQLFTIIQILLSKGKNTIPDTLKLELLNIIIESQETILFEIATKQDTTPSDIETLITNLNNYNALCHFINENTTLQIPLSKTITIDTIDTLINCTHKLFFYLESEMIYHTLQYITTHLSTSISPNTPINQETKDTISNYLINIIPVKVFINSNITKDEIIQQIKQHKLQDKHILITILDELPLAILFKIFNNNPNNFIEFLNNSNLSNPAKQRITIDICNRIIEEEEYYIPYLLKIIISNTPINFLDEKITSNLYNKIIISSLNSSIIYLDNNMIQYLLSAEYLDVEIEDQNEQRQFIQAKQKFIAECHYLIKNKNYLALKPQFDLKKIEQLLSLQASNSLSPEDIAINPTDSITIIEEKTTNRLKLGLDIEFPYAIELLKYYFNNEIELTQDSMKAIIRSIITTMLDTLQVKHNGVFYHTSDQTEGFYENSVLSISINTKAIDNFLNKSNSLYERFELFQSIFHEMTHAIYEDQRRNNNWNIKTYQIQKQWILSEYDFDFYMTNWYTFTEEIEAELNGVDFLMKFIETYFPNILDKVQDQIIEDLEDKKKLNSRSYNEVMCLFAIIRTKLNIAFDNLIKYNPNILERSPILKLEYLPNGQAKTYEQILLGRTEENKHLIDEIIKIKFPEPNHQIHTK